MTIQSDTGQHSEFLQCFLLRHHHHHQQQQGYHCLFPFITQITVNDETTTTQFCLLLIHCRHHHTHHHPPHHHHDQDGGQPWERLAHWSWSRPLTSRRVDASWAHPALSCFGTGMCAFACQKLPLQLVLQHCCGIVLVYGMIQTDLN